MLQLLTLSLAWRKILKDLITYFREIQDSYATRSKGLMKVSNVINNMGTPSLFSSEGGLGDANRILRDYHKQAITEANKARDIENDVISQLSGLRADLGQKIKEIKSLSGDFKNSVEKEKDHTRKAISTLQEALGVVDATPTALVGKEDPYIVRLNVDRQVERQVDEENYLHRVCVQWCCKMLYTNRRRRPTSISRVRGVSSNPLSSEKSKRLTTRLLVF
jgi:hypothetical protein